MKTRDLGIAVLSGLLALSAVRAAQGPADWELDPDASGIGFSVRHLVVSRVEGRFGDFDVRFSGTAPHFRDASIEAVVELASVRTGDSERDEDILKPAFFDADRHPRAVFRSTRIESRGPRRWSLTGLLTLKGITRPVELEVRRLAVAPDGRSRFEAAGRLDRFDFGIRHNPLVEAGGAVIAREVELTFVIELIPRSEGGAR